ncbi:hypothetical protein IE53DRAFT_138698 [Violaceomyces palustris]|uniref:Uncharacterized protein n=1 Tax=Violaceomyces palustris TaxID=1673888 RepID=A0ACD0NUL0_9BASI|nr:hypothetical protein IE53DRAFT_138698 [Violaceomyces palustris]
MVGQGSRQSVDPSDDPRGTSGRGEGKGEERYVPTRLLEECWPAEPTKESPSQPPTFPFPPSPPNPSSNPLPPKPSPSASQRSLQEQEEGKREKG